MWYITILYRTYQWRQLREKIRQWIYQRQSIPWPRGQATRCLLWAVLEKKIVLWRGKIAIGLVIYIVNGNALSREQMLVFSYIEMTIISRFSDNGNSTQLRNTLPFQSKEEFEAICVIIIQLIIYVSTKETPAMYNRCLKRTDSGCNSCSTCM